MHYQALNFSDLEHIELFETQDSIQKFPAHYHDTFCFSLISKGVFIENNKIITPDTILISNPFEVHTNSSLNNLPYSLTTFYINQEIVNYAFSSQENIHLATIIDNPLLVAHLKRISSKIVCDSLDPSASPLYEKEFISFLRRLAPFSSSAHEPAHQPDWLEEVTRFFQTHLQEKIELEKLAKQQHIDKYKFIRAFKKQLGLTPFQYLILLRIMKAKELLQQGESIIEAALSTGFYDQSNFSNYFKLYTGVTPKVYQQGCNILQENQL